MVKIKIYDLTDEEDAKSIGHPSNRIPLLQLYGIVKLDHRNLTPIIGRYIGIASMVGNA